MGDWWFPASLCRCSLGTRLLILPRHGSVSVDPPGEFLHDFWWRKRCWMGRIDVFYFLWFSEVGKKQHLAFWWNLGWKLEMRTSSIHRFQRFQAHFSGWDTGQILDSKVECGREYIKVIPFPWDQPICPGRAISFHPYWDSAIVQYHLCRLIMVDFMRHGPHFLPCQWNDACLEFSKQW